MTVRVVVDVIEVTLYASEDEIPDVHDEDAVNAWVERNARRLSEAAAEHACMGHGQGWYVTGVYVEEDVNEDAEGDASTTS